MIQELKIKNFRSFRDEATLNFEATKDTAFEECQVVEVAPGVRLLRLALLFGANASGKSNVLEAVEFLREFWFAGKTDMDAPTGAVPFLLDKETPSQDTVFELKFWLEGVKYWYLLSLNNRQVSLEKLYRYASVQPTLVFQRELEGGQSVIKFNPAAVKVSAAVTEELTLKCLPNMSFFAARGRVNCSLPAIDEVRDWLKTGFLPIIEPRTMMFDYAGKKMLEDASLKDYMLDFVHKADFNITGVNAEMKSEPMPSYIVEAVRQDQDIPNDEKENVLKNPVFQHVQTEFEHTVLNERGLEKYVLPKELQSEGTRRTFGVEAAIYEALKNEKFLPVDEIESSLHPDLVEFILEQFLRMQNHSQLLITSHYDPLLNTIDDLLRKDCVWFTEKGDDGCSQLYSLVEFKGLNKINSFQKSYRNGAFGALPNIKG